MAIYFFDTSALVKRYASEVGSAWVCQLTDPRSGNNIYIAEVTGVELIAAIMKKTRDTKNPLPLADAQKVIQDFRDDFLHQYLYDIVSLTSRLIQDAMSLPEKHKLRGYDAVQLASALAVRTQTMLVGAQSLLAGVPASAGPAFSLVSCDDELLDAARAEGISVDDPRNHP